MMPIICRSPITIAEDTLLAVCSRVHNVSRAEAVHYQIQRREIGATYRKQAEELLEVWAGTDEQIKLVNRLYMCKQSSK